jgi:hypothetical protein
MMTEISNELDRDTAAEPGALAGVNSSACSLPQHTDEAPATLETTDGEHEGPFLASSPPSLGHLRAADVGTVSVCLRVGSSTTCS